MIPDFNFVGFEPNDELKESSSKLLERLLDLAPFGSIAVAQLVQDELSFHCTIEIYSKFGPFIACASGASPQKVLENASESVTKKMRRWKQTRKNSISNKRIFSAASAL